MKPRLAVFGVFVWAFALYMPTFAHPFVTWDDPIYIMLNPTVQQWWQATWAQRLLTARLLYPVPLPVGIYAAATALLGDHAATGIHVLSATIHGFNAVLLYLLGRRLTGAMGASLAAALLWASHPLMVESVAWATNLKELLMTLAVLGCLLVFAEHQTSPKRLVWLAPLTAIGFASKPTFAVVGGLLLVVAWHHRDVRKAAIASVLSVVGGLYVLWTSAGHSAQMDLALASRDPLVTIGKAAGLQALHTLWPFQLNPYYPLPLQSHDALSVLGWLVIACALACVAYFAKTRAMWSLGIALAVVAWLPYSNVLPLPRFTADTYAYLPGIGVALAMASVLARSDRLFWMGLIVAAGLALLSSIQVQRWSSTEALWGPLLGDPDHFALPYSLVAFEAHLLGDNERAAELLDAAWPQLVDQVGEPGFAKNVFEAVGRPPRP
ncbi:MAG: glycosyltransferase family 39 protein [bacterium]